MTGWGEGLIRRCAPHPFGALCVCWPTASASVVASRPGMRLRRCACRTGFELRTSHGEKRKGPHEGALSFFGWGRGIRTPVGGVRVRSPTTRRSPNRSMNATNRSYQDASDLGEGLAQIALGRPSCLRPVVASLRRPKC